MNVIKRRSPFTDAGPLELLRSIRTFDTLSRCWVDVNSPPLLDYMCIIPSKWYKVKRFWKNIVHKNIRNYRKVFVDIVPLKWYT